MQQNLQENNYLKSLKKGEVFKKLDMEQMIALINRCSLLVGIPNDKMPSKNTMYVIVDSILRYFGTMTTEEILAAFEMSAAGIINAPDHYSQFSFKYFASVINTWKAKINEEVKKIHDEKPVEEKYEGEVDWSDVVQMIKEMPMGKYWHNIIVPLDIYDWLIRTGKINPTGEEKKAAMEMVRNKMFHELYGLNVTSTSKGDEYRLLTAIQYDYKGKGSEGYEIVVRETKKKFIIDYIKSLK